MMVKRTETSLRAADISAPARSIDELARGQREWGSFLRDFGVLLPLLARLSRTASLTRGDLYLHWKGGFALTKPEGWEWHRPLNPDLVFGRQLTDFDAFDQQVAIGDLVNLDDSHFPLITGYDPSRGHKISGAGSPEVDTIAPSFRVLFEEIRDNDVPLLDHVERDLEAFQEGLMGFELLSPIRLREVTGCDSAHYTSGYQYAHENIPEWIPIRERVVYVRGRWAIFSVRMCDYPAVDPGLLHDFDPFVEKLWFI